MNYDNLKNKYIGVRASRGGGIRTVHFRNEIDASVILDEAKTLFFPCGKSNFGNIDKFIVNLGNYKGELIKDNEFENFTLSECIIPNKLSKTRLNMLTGKKIPNRIILDQANSFISASDDEIDKLDFSHSSSHDGFETSPQTQNLFLLGNDRAMMNPTINSLLLGTNEERDILKNEIDRAYCESLAKEMEKEKSNVKYKQNKSEQISNNRENAGLLMEQRKSRLIPESDLVEDHVVVSLRHTT